MVRIEKARPEDTDELTEIQTRTFQDDNRLKPPGCSSEGPPGYDSVEWNAERIAETLYYKILLGERIVGGIIVFEMGPGWYELGRIYIDPEVQDRGIGQRAIELMFDAFPQAERWTLGTPSWATRNRHVYEKMGFVKVRETAVDPHLGWASVEYERGMK